MKIRGGESTSGAATAATASPSAVSVRPKPNNTTTSEPVRHHLLGFGSNYFRPLGSNFQGMMPFPGSAGGHNDVGEDQYHGTACREEEEVDDVGTSGGGGWGFGGKDSSKVRFLSLGPDDEMNSEHHKNAMLLRPSALRAGETGGSSRGAQQRLRSTHPVVVGPQMRKILIGKKKEQEDVPPPPPPLNDDQQQEEENNDEEGEGKTTTGRRVLPTPLSHHPPIATSCTATSTVHLSPSGQLYQTGFLHGRMHADPTLCPIRLPLVATQIACGRRHVMALLEEGVVVSWGAGHFGQLGHVGEDGTESGAGGSREPRIVEGLLPQRVGGRVTHIAAGGLHSAAIISSSPNPSLNTTRTFAWGSNRRNQCGLESGRCHTVPRPQPVMAVLHPDTGDLVSFTSLSLGRLHSVGLTDDGEVYTWGSTGMGRCGHGPPGGDPHAPPGSPASMASSRRSRGGGGRHSMTPPRRVEALKDVKIVQVSAGDGHTLALTGGGRVFSWGCGSDGQLGHGHTMHLLSPRLVGDLDFGAGFAVGGRELRRTLEREEEEEEAEADTEEQEQRRRALLGVAGGKDDGDSKSKRQQLTSPNEERHPPSPPRRAQTPPPVPPTPPPSSPPLTPPPFSPLPIYTSSPPLQRRRRSSSSTTSSYLRNTASRITSISASGNYSTALSTSGDLYTWGYGDPRQLGHPPPSPSTSLHLPYVEPGPMSRTGPGNRIRDSKSFDSDLNVLLPRRVDCVREWGLRVDSVSCGPTHMILTCSERDEAEEGSADVEGDEGNSVGRTLYELERGRRSKGLNRLRTMGSERTLDERSSLKSESATATAAAGGGANLSRAPSASVQGATTVAGRKDTNEGGPDDDKTAAQSAATGAAAKDGMTAAVAEEGVANKGAGDGTNDRNAHADSVAGGASSQAVASATSSEPPPTAERTKATKQSKAAPSSPTKQSSSSSSLRWMTRKLSGRRSRAASASSSPPPIKSPKSSTSEDGGAGGEGEQATTTTGTAPPNVSVRSKGMSWRKGFLNATFGSGASGGGGK